MSSLEITLNEFVAKIPLCQANVSWDKLVVAIGSSPNGIIAIVDPNFHPLGILESHRLLAQMAKDSLTSRMIAEETPQSFLEPVGLTSALRLKSLISRITTLSSQTKLEDFIALLNHRESLSAEENYLIVDATGKVQGILDLPKLLKYVAQDYAIQKLDRQSCAPRLQEIPLAECQTLFTLWEQIPLPLILHDAEGNICYQNPAWCQHLPQHQEVPLTDFPQHSNLSAAPELAWQSAMFSPTPDLRTSAIYTQCYCPIEQDGGQSLFIGPQPQPLNYLPETFFFKDYSQDAIADDKGLRAQNSTDPNNSKLDWHYMRFPIQLAAKTLAEIPHHQSSQQYWLVLGTQLSSSDKRKTHNTPVRNPNNHQFRGIVEPSIQSSSELDKLRRLQNEFMVNISHDLKSPLTAIIGLSSLLREEKLGSLNPRQIRYLDLIYRGGRQLMGIVTDLLDITSLATGKLRLKLETIELEKFCRQAYQQVVTKLEAVKDPHNNRSLVLPQFQFHLELDSSEIIADRLRFNQILTRLLENAIKATPAEGEIGIKVERWTDWVAIIVWDTGRGFSETFQASLLEEMFEPDSFLAPPERATGLGLIFAQQLARSHGGDISFTSQINRGSEFTLLLPANPLKISEQDDFALSETVLTADSNRHHQSNLVLIVETSPEKIQDLTASLQQLGYHAAIARDRNEALYKANHLQPSKIILNQELIELTGQNILATLKSDPQTSQIPVILICEHHPLPKYQYSQVEKILLSPFHKINSEVLSQHFPPLKGRNYCPEKRLTILRLCLNQGDKNLTGSEIDLLFDNSSFNLCHHIIEADSLEQANILVKIWNIDLIIWDGSNLASPLELLRALVSFPNLAQIPLVTLDEQTTAAANQFDHLTVFPCLVPINEQNITELMQVIQSAATVIDNES